MFQIQWVSPAPWIDGFRSGSDFGPHWSCPLSRALKNSLLWTATCIHPELYWMHVLGFRPQNKEMKSIMKNIKLE